MRKTLLLLAVALLSVSAVFAQEKVKRNQYGVAVKSDRLDVEAQDGILVFESQNSAYKLWFDTRIQADTIGSWLQGVERIVVDVVFLFDGTPVVRIHQSQGVGSANQTGCSRGIDIFITNLSIVNDDLSAPTDVAVLSAAIHRTKDTRAVFIRCGIGIFTDGDMGMVDIAREELRAIMITR